MTHPMMTPYESTLHTT